MSRWFVTTGLLLALAGVAGVGQAMSIDAVLVALQGPDREADDAARDVYRHPAETLRFFGVTREMTIVELMPGGGWYTRILAPLVRDQGRYIGVEYEPDTFGDDFPQFVERLRKYPESVKARPELFGANAHGTWILTGDIAEPGSVDMVLGIRFLHNWISRGFADEALDRLHDVLEPGGVFGVVQHRAAEDDPRDAVALAKTGYVKQSHAIALMKKHGFELVEQSEVNANPKDTKDHPRGVWTLPPTLRLGDEDKEKYLAIGESDRMTLKFAKAK